MTAEELKLHAQAAMECQKRYLDAALAEAMNLRGDFALLNARLQVAQKRIEELEKSSAGMEVI